MTKMLVVLKPYSLVWFLLVTHLNITIKIIVSNGFLHNFHTRLVYYVDKQRMIKIILNLKLDSK